MYALDRSVIKWKDWTITKKLNENLTARIQTNHGYTKKKLRKRLAYVKQGWGQVQYLYLVLVLSTYLSVLEYLVYGNVKVLVLVLDQKVLGTYK